LPITQQDSKVIFKLLILIFILSSCNYVPSSLLTLQKSALEIRNLQTRNFDSNSEKNILKASISALQDMGYSIQETESSLGVITGSKEVKINSFFNNKSPFDFNIGINKGFSLGNSRSSRNGVNIGIGNSSLNRKERYNVKKETNVTIVSSPTNKINNFNLRASFQVNTYDNFGDISNSTTIKDPKLYQEFFSKISNSVFYQDNL